MTYGAFLLAVVAFLFFILQALGLEHRADRPYNFLAAGLAALTAAWVIQLLFVSAHHMVVH